MWQRLQSLPADTFYALYEQWSVVDWEEFDAAVTIPGAVVANVLLNMAAGRRDTNDVLLTTRRTTSYGWAVVAMLAALSVVNWYRCFFTRRAYRLFETSLAEAPQTPSAKIVRVQRSSHSPLYIRIFGEDKDPSFSKEVWEVGIWSPPPLTLSFFCYFSPLHAFLGYMYPSMRTLFLTLLLSGQLKLLSQRFQLQQHDRRIIYGQVMQEYDTKFVRPRTSVRTRDVSIGVDGQVRVSTPVAQKVPPKAPRKESPVKHSLGPPPMYGPKSKTTTSGTDMNKMRLEPGVTPRGSSSRNYIPSPLSKRRKFDP